MPWCGGNFSFLVDYGKNAKFGCGADAYSLIQRGESGGFLISRPRHEDARQGEKPETKTAGKEDPKKKLTANRSGAARKITSGLGHG